METYQHREAHGLSSRGRGRSLLGLPAVAAVACVLLVVGAAAAGCGGGLDRAQAREAEGDLAGAVTEYRNLLAGEPENLDALSGLAVALVMLQRWDEALAVQERVVALDADDTQTRTELGFNYLNHQDRPADAVRVFREAAVIEPSGKHLAFLAQAQIAGGDIDGAEQTLREAVETEPPYARAFSMLIDLLEESGRTEDAAQVGRDAAAALPGSGQS